MFEISADYIYERNNCIKTYERFYKDLIKQRTFFKNYHSVVAYRPGPGLI
jgi:hypothetical protein